MSESLRSERRTILPKVLRSANQHVADPNQIEMDLSLSFHQAFCIDTSQDLCRMFELPTWSTMLLHACTHHSFIRHAMAAIGILSQGESSPLMTTLQHQAPAPKPTSTEETPTKDQQVALLHYSKFLEGSRSASFTEQNAGRQSRIASVVCILTVCLETLQFHHEQALRNIEIGHKVIDGWGAFSPPPSPRAEGGVCASDFSTLRYARQDFESEIISTFDLLQRKVDKLEACLGRKGSMSYPPPLLNPEPLQRRESHPSLYQTQSAPEASVSSVSRRESFQRIYPMPIDPELENPGPVRR
jgi:hypothetical protein